MMRRAPRLGPLVLAALCGWSAVASAQVVVGPRAASIALTPGGNVTVPIVADMTGGGGVSLGSLTARLSWRPGTLRFDGIEPGTFGTPALNLDSAAGTLRLAVANPGGATGEVVILQAKFYGLGANGDTTSLTLTVDEMTAAGTFAAIAPVATASLVCVGSASGRWGDLNGDEAITSFDALLIVTHAVGLPITPHTAGAGDVDADGDTDTRDALIVLSNVVGLPTPGFRPGQSIGASCGGNPPATVSATPAGLSLVVGDTVTATAVARDSAGRIVSILPGLRWTTLNPAVATVAPAGGPIAAVGAGTADVVVVVSLGVMDTIPVTVTATRRVWYVDVAAATRLPAQHGSPAYPFESLQQAVDRAAEGDTIVVRGGSYPRGAVTTKALTIIGDPAYAPPRFQGDLVLDGPTSGVVRLRRLIVADAPVGIQVRGAGRTLLLDSVGVERAGGHGIDVVGIDSLDAFATRVSGANRAGIIALDVRAIALRAVRVDAVTFDSSATGYGLVVRRAQSVVVDSSSFRLGLVQIDTVPSVRLRKVQVAESYTALLRIFGASTIDLDSVSLRMGGDFGFTDFAATLDVLPGGTVTGRDVEVRDVSGNGLSVVHAALADFAGLRVSTGANAGSGIAAAFAGVNVVRVRRAELRGGRLWQFDDAFGAARVLALDSVAFDDARVQAAYLDTLRIRVAWFNGAAGVVAPLLDVDSVGVVSLVGVEAQNAPSGYPALRVSRADSLWADSLYLHDNPNRALEVDYSRTAVVARSRFTGNALAYLYAGTVALSYTPTARIAQSVFDEAGRARSLQWYGYVDVPQSLTVDTTTFRGSQTGVLAYANYPAAVTLRGVGLERGARGYGQQLVNFSVRGRVRVLDSRVDSTDYGEYAIYGGADTLDVLNTQMRFVGSGIYVTDFSGTGLPVTVANNVIECRPGSGGSYYGMQINSDSASITGNAVSRCWNGISVQWSSGRNAIIRNNTVTALDSASGQGGILLLGNWSRAAIAGNTVSGGRMAYGGIYLAASTAFDSTRVDSNVVEDGRGKGIYLYGQMRGVQLRGNTIRRMRPLNANADAAIHTETGFGTDTLRIVGNRLLQNRTRGMYLAYASGGAPIRVDTNVVVDDSLTGIYIDQGTKVVGRGNFLARNAEGLYAYGTVTIDSSVIQQSAVVGARAVGEFPVNLATNFWGDATGPRCGVNCPGALGDSVEGVLSYTPFLPSAPPTPTGAPPALRPVAALVAPAVRPQAVTAAWFEEQRRVLRARLEGER